ncbi:MAG TPA: hypothetical protein VHT74_15935 [Acetobacteraceae bacterium]|jgi:hypothetical protein|nr:hypothetical protein [Acetobacteraceae bacterium]
MQSAAATPYVAFDPATSALVLFDMQCDVLEPGGLAAALGHDVGRLRPAIAPTGQVLRACAPPVCWRSAPARAIDPTCPTPLLPSVFAAASPPASATPTPWAAS